MLTYSQILPLLAYHRNASFAAAEDDTDGDSECKQDILYIYYV